MHPRRHPLFQTVEETKENPQGFYSDHLTIFLPVPLSKTNSTTKTQHLNIISLNILGDISYSGLHTADATAETEEETHARYDRTAAGLAINAKNFDAGVIGLQEATPEYIVPHLKEHLGDDWAILVGLSQGGYDKSLITCYNQKDWELYEYQQGYDLRLTEDGAEPEPYKIDLSEARSQDGKEIIGLEYRVMVNGIIKKNTITWRDLDKQANIQGPTFPNQEFPRQLSAIMASKEQCLPLILARTSQKKDTDYQLSSSSLDILDKERVHTLALRNKQTGEIVYVNNVWGDYSPFPNAAEKTYKAVLKKNPKEISVIFGDTNSRITPIDNEITNGTTGIVPLKFNQKNGVPADQPTFQVPDHPDGGFYRDLNGEIHQIKHKVLSFEGGEIVKDTRTIDEQQPIWDEYRMVMCLDDFYQTEKLIQDKTIFEFENEVQQNLNDQNILVRMAATCHNHKAIAFRFNYQNCERFYDLMKEFLKKEKGIQCRYVEGSVGLTNKAFPCIFVPLDKAPILTSVVNRVACIAKLDSYIDSLNLQYNSLHVFLDHQQRGAIKKRSDAAKHLRDLLINGEKINTNNLNFVDERMFDILDEYLRKQLPAREITSECSLLSDIVIKACKEYLAFIEEQKNQNQNSFFSINLSHSEEGKERAYKILAHVVLNESANLEKSLITLNELIQGSSDKPHSLKTILNNKLKERCQFTLEGLIENPERFYTSKEYNNAMMEVIFDEYINNYRSMFGNYIDQYIYKNDEINMDFLFGQYIKEVNADEIFQGYKDLYLREGALIANNYLKCVDHAFSQSKISLSSGVTQSISLTDIFENKQQEFSNKIKTMYFDIIKFAFPGEAINLINSNLTDVDYNKDFIDRVAGTPETLKKVLVDLISKATPEAIDGIKKSFSVAPNDKKPEPYQILVFNNLVTEAQFEMEKQQHHVYKK